MKNNKKQNKGITLISLVITIVIMLILAGVSINLIIDNNGLFSKSKTSAEKYTQESVKEELQMAVASLNLDETDTNLTNEQIANNMKEELSGITWTSIENLSGTYKGYDFYIGDNYTVVLEKNEAPVIETCMINLTSVPAVQNNLDKIYNINISTVDTMPEYPEEALNDYKFDLSDINISEAGRVIGYLKNSSVSGLYDLCIIGKDTIKLPSDCTGFFKNMKNVYTINGLEKLDTINVTNMDSMFWSFGCNNMTSLILPDSFNTKNVTNMNGMFLCCGISKLKTFSLGNNFNTLNVKNMSNMFASFGSTLLETLILPDTFNTSKVEDMSNMFVQCGSNSMTTFNLGNNFNTASVTNMSGMFNQCGKKLTTFTIPTTFNTSNVINMEKMFYYFGYNSLQTLDISKCNFNTSKVTNMNAMFYMCGMQSMKTLNIGDKLDTSNLLDGGSMFYYCGYNQMTALDFSKCKLDLSKVTNRTSMFEECGNKAMISLNLGTNFKLPVGAKAEDRMFYDIGTSACVISVPSSEYDQVHILTNPRTLQRI